MENSQPKIPTSQGLTLDKIIEKCIPIIGAIFMIIGFGYLVYTSVWIHLDTTIRLGLGFFMSLVIIGGAYSLSEKFRYFADIGIGAGILLLYATLMYGSRTTDIAVAAMIPEVATLVTAVIFTTAIAYFASQRRSQIILILGMAGAYLTPFTIGQNDVWVQNISFNAYLTYFAATNIAIFLLGREISVRNIIPLNILGLFIGTSALYSLSYSEEYSIATTTNFFGGEYFSAILFLTLVSFAIWSILLSAKKFEEKDEGYLAIGYIAPVLWFIWNLSELTLISDGAKTGLYAILSIICFSGWHTLREMHTRFQHTALYASAILCAILAFFAYIPALSIYSSMILAYASLVFAGLFVIDSTKWERFVSYVLLALIGGILSIIHSYNTVFQSFYVTIALIPLMGAYFLARRTPVVHQHIGEYAKFISVSSASIALLFLFEDFVRYIDISFLLFFALPLGTLGYLAMSKKQSNGSTSGVLRVVMIWFGIGFVGTFLALISSVYPAPANTSLLVGGGSTDWTLINGVFATGIIFLGLCISRRLQTLQKGKRPSFILVIFGYTTLLLVGNYIILALMNDMGVPMGQGGPRAIATTLWWIAIALWMLIIGIKKGLPYKSEKFLGLILLALTIAKILFYDLETMAMQNKIIVLMVVGGALMLFSYGVQTKGWLKSDNNNPNPKGEEKESRSDLEPCEHDSKNNEAVGNKKIINEKLEHISIGNTHAVIFTTNTKGDQALNSKNSIKIAKFVTKEMGKTVFKPRELSRIYDYILANYTSDLSPQDAKKIIEIIEEFVELGGEITFK